MSDKAKETRERRESIKEALRKQYRAQTIDELKEIQTCLGLVIKAKIRDGKKGAKLKKRIEEAEQIIKQHEALLAAGVASVYSEARIKKERVIANVPEPESVKKKAPAKKKTKKKTTKKKATKKR